MAKNNIYMLPNAFRQRSPLLLIPICRFPRKAKKRKKKKRRKKKKKQKVETYLEMANAEVVSGFMAAAMDREDVGGSAGGSIGGSGSGLKIRTGSSMVGKTPTQSRRERAEGPAGSSHVGIGGSHSGLGGTGSGLDGADRYASAKMTRTKTLVGMLSY
jgi:hypothetical protein